ncbi:MAG: hypothetical protein J5947_10535 [Clostridium sp.]|nr:hypothetical protein [Clostridium sp.]
MAERENINWNDDEILESHIRAAVDALVPDVWDRLDLTVPQDSAGDMASEGTGEAAQAEVQRPAPDKAPEGTGDPAPDKAPVETGDPAPIYRMYRRMRTIAVAAAACLCIVIAGGGVSFVRNRQVDSVVGIDVNPSVRLSVNRKERILKAEPLNDDAEVILDDMDLTQVDLNIGVNALIGSMVRHGYLDDLDNAILVTVSNNDRNKAATVRREVVTEVASSLEEHRVSAVVYDQEMEETDEIRALADKYGISIGKAYFLSELVEENDLSEEDLKKFAGMNMEEIAREIAESSYRLRKTDEEDDGAPEMTEITLAQTTPPETTPAESTEAESSSESESAEESSSAEESTEDAASAEKKATEESAESSAWAENLSEREIEESVGIGMTEAEEVSVSSSKLKVKIDNVDFDDGRLSVHFKSKVEWKSPSVSVEDQDGETYSAKIVENDSESCEIEVYGLDGGLSCEFIIGGVGSQGEHSYGSVKGYFDTPEIAEGAMSSNHSKSRNQDEDSDRDDEDDDDDSSSGGGSGSGGSGNTGDGNNAGGNSSSGSSGSGNGSSGNSGGADSESAESAGASAPEQTAAGTENQPAADAGSQETAAADSASGGAAGSQTGEGTSDQASGETGKQASGGTDTVSSVDAEAAADNGTDANSGNSGETGADNAANSAAGAEAGDISAAAQ